MPGDPLEEVRVTAERVERFTSDVERDGTDETRHLWRAALSDLRDAIRRARARGFETDDIQEATGDQPIGTFVRAPAVDETAPPREKV